MVSVYSYMNYRDFLKSRFQELKAKNARFSYRAFNRLAGLKSSGFLKLVMDGKRNLGTDGIRGIAKALRFNESEQEYFENLVFFNQAEEHAIKERYFKKILTYQVNTKIKAMTLAQHELFGHWYYVAILELLRVDAPYRDVFWLQQHLHPTVSLKEIEQAIKKLKVLGLLEDDPERGYVTGENLLRPQDDVLSLYLINFHQEMCRRAETAVARDAYEDREFSGLTVALSPQGFARAKKHLQDFRKKLHELLEQEDLHERRFVAHVNLQIFKLSREPKKKGIC